MKITSPASSLLTLFFWLTVLGGSANADLIINISQTLTGGTQFEFIGTGTVGADPFGRSDLMNFVSTGDSFIRDSTPGMVYTDMSPSLSLGDMTTSRVFLGDMQGDFNVHSRLGFGDAGIDNAHSFGTFQNGAQASDLNGIYVSDIAFSAFVPGTYQPTLGFTEITNSLKDIGTITIHVNSVPEPSSFFFATGIGIAILSRSRPKRSFVSP